MSKLSSREGVIPEVRALVDDYSKKPTGSGRVIPVLHDEFADFSTYTKGLIEGVFGQVYADNFQMLRDADYGRLTFLLGLVSDALKREKCTDVELQARINGIRSLIAPVVTKVDFGGEYRSWLRGVGFSDREITQLIADYNISEVVAGLREDFEEYKSILGGAEYVVKLLTLPQGWDKLKRLPSFHDTYDRKLIEFTGPQLIEILSHGKWRKKLKYLENRENLKVLADAGVTAGQLSQVMRTGVVRERLRYLEDKEKMGKMKAAGFNTSNLVMIMKEMDWAEKLAYFEDEENVVRLKAAGLIGRQLARLLQGDGWRERLSEKNYPAMANRVAQFPKDEGALIGEVRALVGSQSAQPAPLKRTIPVLHKEFDGLSEDTRRLIEGVLWEVYADDFQMLKVADYGKLEFYLGLVSDALGREKCADLKLCTQINDIRGRIAIVATEALLSEEDMAWLKGLGLSDLDVFKLTANYDISEVMIELRENFGEYLSILGDVKYIVKILKFFEGWDKLKRLPSFDKNYESGLIKFNGAQFFEILINGEWKEKLEYIEEKENLEAFVDAGFKGSQLSQIMRNAGWKAKVRVALTEACLKLVEKKGENTGLMTHSGLAQLLKKKDWRERLKELGVEV